MDFSEKRYEKYRDVVIKKDSSPEELINEYDTLLELDFEFKERAFALLNVWRPEVAETIKR